MTLSSSFMAVFLTLLASMNPLLGSKQSKVSLTLSISAGESPLLMYRCIGKLESWGWWQGQTLFPIIILSLIGDPFHSIIKAAYNTNKLTYMNRLGHNHIAPLELLLDVYSEGSFEAISAFIEKRYTRFHEPQPKPTYYERYLSYKNQQFEVPLTTREQFVNSCVEMGIDVFYYTNLVDYICSLEQEQKAFLLNHELREMKAGKSYFHLIKKIIKARQNCLKNMKCILEQTIRESIARLSELDKLCMQMIHMRMLTLVLVEAIYQWNYSMGSLFQEGCKQIKYEQGGVQIFREICEDTDFLRYTVLRKYLKFAKGFDPLLMRIGRRRRQGSLNKVDDVDRFADFFQPDFNILPRLRQAETVLIKYHSNKSFNLKEQPAAKSLANFKVKQPEVQPLQEIRQVSNTRDIEPAAVLTVKPQRIDLPRILPSNQTEVLQREPGFIKSTAPKFKHQVQPAKMVNQQMLTGNHERQTKIMERIKQLREQLKNNSYIETQFKQERVRYHSEPNQLAQAQRGRYSMKSIYKALPTNSDHKLEHITTKKKRVSQKAQKMRFLRHIYRDKARADLEVELKLIKSRGSQAVKRRRKQKRQQSLGFRMCTNSNLDSGDGSLRDLKTKYCSPY